MDVSFFFLMLATFFCGMYVGMKIAKLILEDVISMASFDEQLDFYEQQLCEKYRSCSDCPSNITDDYGTPHCGFDLVRDGIEIINNSK